MEPPGADAGDVPGADAAGAPRANARAPTAELMLALPARPSTASVVRDRIRHWLDELGWPAEHGEDIVMAANEAVANAIDHAYRDRPAGPVHLHAWPVDRPDERKIVVSVTDRGRWQPPDVHRGHRGHGLPMILACMQAVHIDRTPAGTAVVMTSRAVPTAAPTPGTAAPVVPQAPPDQPATHPGP